MSGAASYILSVTAAALLAAILKTLAGQGSMGTLVKFLAGLFMAVTILSPLRHLELPDMNQWLTGIHIDGASAAAVGEEMADEASAAIINQRLEAYILDKAGQLGASLVVDVTLNDDGIPAAVTLEGEIAPGAKGKLAEILETELGLPKEVQHWIS